LLYLLFFVQTLDEPKYMDFPNCLSTADKSESLKRIVSLGINERLAAFEDLLKKNQVVQSWVF